MTQESQGNVKQHEEKKADQPKKAEPGKLPAHPDDPKKADQPKDPKKGKAEAEVDNHWDPAGPPVVESEGEKDPEGEKKPTAEPERTEAAGENLPPQAEPTHPGGPHPEKPPFEPSHAGKKETVY